MVGVIGPKDKSLLNQIRMEGVTVINTTSHSSGWTRGLSPFLAGPIKLYGNFSAHNVENAWQYSKVYKEHINQQGEPTENYWQWAKQGWEKIKADRYPMGKDRKPEYSYWDGKHFSYVEARKKIYAPLYIKAVVPSTAFKTLKKIYKEKGRIYLWDFDGYDYLTMGKSLRDVINDPNKSTGHSFILAMLLTLSKNEILDILEIKND